MLLFWGNNFIKNKFMGGNGKLELILYQQMSEMGFRAAYMTSGPGKTP